jgi:hypothetical protein
MNLRRNDKLTIGTTGMAEKPLGAIPQRRTLPPFKGNLYITFILNSYNRASNNFYRIPKGFDAVSAVPSLRIMALTFYVTHVTL